jgi:hypothetical protein
MTFTPNLQGNTWKQSERLIEIPKRSDQTRSQSQLVVVYMFRRHTVYVKSVDPVFYTVYVESFQHVLYTVYIKSF